ncbi:MAG: hypothetical protein JXM72_03515 [Deltaproteobacteria bacterium]|nr:hypothetical protein [Deltaproteobacteria bacterium]
MKTPFVRKANLTRLLVGGAVILSVLCFSYLILAERSEDFHNTNSRSEQATGYDLEHLRVKSYGKNTSTNPISLEDRLVAELKQYYGKTISEKSTQAMLLRFKNFITGMYPDDGESRFYAILKKAFPALADEIMQTLQKMEQYNAWLEENERMLAGLSFLEKQGMLWEKRRDLFGEDADIVWSEEVLAYEERKQDMKDTIRMLDSSDETTIDEKLAIYKSTLSQAYADSPEAYILENTGMLAKVFFSIDSVQEELAELDPDQRKLEIARIRKEMGYTSKQIDELSAMDDYRSRRWETGLNYMEERGTVEANYTGAQLDDQLRLLREKYFKHEAKTIELEEKDGFFRFERKRYYGRN